MHMIIFLALAILISVSAYADPPNARPNPPLNVTIADQPVAVTGQVSATLDEPVEVTGQVSASLDGPIAVTGQVSATLTEPANVIGTVSPDLVDMIPVTLVQRVQPDNTPEDRSGDTTITVRLCIGSGPCTTSDAALGDRIRQGSDEVLVVTSLTAFNFDSPLPAVDGYGLLNSGACKSGFFPRQFGIPVISTDGRKTTHVTLRPGVLVSDLLASERLCFTSFLQSTVAVDVTLHGYLTPRP